ncbi:ubiquitin-like protein 3 [Echinops telfairi]|uniref:Ubiquitin-like protein 3 n=1 Tax=Echinops telfairi TaxID=9371 RepID=A0AC55DDU6_ECHTE|nr:ubiquitin-like protein 3 [Echinops telfairi]
MSSSVPADMINLRLILVSGKTKEFLFSPNDSASDIAKHVYDNWPMDWEEEQVSSPNILRLIYQGRFLHGNVTLGALKLPFGKTTVMHLVARETLPEPNSQGEPGLEAALRFTTWSRVPGNTHRGSSTRKMPSRKGVWGRPAGAGKRAVKKTVM